MKLQMIEIKKVTGSSVFEDGLDDRIVECDKLNMSRILADAGVTFPEEMRRKGLENNPTILIAFVDDEFAGYLEYCRSWDNEKHIYLSSLQILAEYRSSALLAALLGATRKALLKEDFNLLVSEVLKSNIPAIRLYQKLGFTLAAHSHKRKYLDVRAAKSILKNRATLKILSRYNRNRLLDTAAPQR